jgi:formate hydrogenlyase subunit 6/NADH:ubiquinone oxidoreductase subunit I
MGWIAFGLTALLALLFLVTSVAEREWRAAGLTVPLAILTLGVLGAPLLIDFPGRFWVLLALLVLGALGLLLLVLPLGKSPPVQVPGPLERVDERDAVFHRFYRIRPGTEEFEAYYRDHPEKQAFDEKVRALPPLGGPGSKTYHPLSSVFQVAAFSVLEEITRDIEWEPEPLGSKMVQAPPEEFSRRLKGFARYLGADLVGCAKLNPAWVYSHIGRSPGTFGAPIELEHKYAVAIAVEMSHDMVRQAPDSPTTTETAFKYFEVGKIAMILARTINLLGYPARAHLDGNYRVMCVPVAADAGLGELGRLGLLVTRRFGPRVRLAVVTTDLPLEPDEPVAFGVQHFCELCKKCAAVCPSGSVDTGTKDVYAGVMKWQTRQDTCYRAWRTQGSDCNLCVKACPYSHPATPVHNLVRWMTARNALARSLLLKADDLFYGRRPKGVFRTPTWHANTPKD